MSKINGNGGFGEIVRRLMPSAPAAADATTGKEATQSPKAAGDQNLIGTSSASRLSLTSATAAAPQTPSDLVRGSKDLNDLIQTVSKGEFPGLKLSPVQAAGLANYIRDHLAARGLGDDSFNHIKHNLV